MPGLGALLPVAVEPEQIRLVCLGELGKLRLVEIHEALPADGIVRDGVAGLVLGEVGVVRMRPVQQGIVEPHFQSPLARFLDKRRQDVAAGRCLLRDAEIGGPGVPKGDAVVVFGRDNRVFRTALPDEVRPIGRVVLRGCEPVLLGHVLLVGKVFVVKGPAFGHAVHGIDSPMDEDAQLGAVEPGHPGGLLLRRFSGPLRAQRQDGGHQRDTKESQSFHTYKDSIFQRF